MLGSLSNGGMKMQDTSQDTSPSEKGHASFAREGSEFARPPAMDPDDNQWKVERLIAKRQIGRGFQYLVKWLGYPVDESTWEKKRDIDPNIVATFEASLSPI